MRTVQTSRTGWCGRGIEEKKKVKRSLFIHFAKHAVFHDFLPSSVSTAVNNTLKL